MSLETASYIHQLNPNNPSGADKLKQGDDHIRMIKAALKATFPGISGPLDPGVTHTLLNSLIGNLIPAGFIGIWYGSSETVPDGWAICNGQTVARSDGSGTITTPDFRDKAVTGATAERPVGTTYGQWDRTFTSAVAGSHSHAATVSEAGAHSHTGATGSTVLTVGQLPSHSHLMAKSGISNNALTNTVPLAQERTAGGDTEYILTGGVGEADVGRTSAAGSNEGHTHTIQADGGHIHNVTISGGGDHSHAVSINTAQPSIAQHFIMKV